MQRRGDLAEMMGRVQAWPRDRQQSRYAELVAKCDEAHGGLTELEHAELRALKAILEHRE